MSRNCLASYFKSNKLLFCEKDREISSAAQEQVNYRYRIECSEQLATPRCRHFPAGCAAYDPHAVQSFGDEGLIQNSLFLSAIHTHSSNLHSYRRVLRSLLELCSFVLYPPHCNRVPSILTVLYSLHDLYSLEYFQILHSY